MEILANRVAVVASAFGSYSMIDPSTGALRRTIGGKASALGLLGDVVLAREKDQFTGRDLVTGEKLWKCAWPWPDQDAWLMSTSTCVAWAKGTFVVSVGEEMCGWTFADRRAAPGPAWTQRVPDGGRELISSGDVLLVAGDGSTTPIDPLTGRAGGRRSGGRATMGDANGYVTYEENTFSVRDASGATLWSAPIQIDVLGPEFVVCRAWDHARSRPTGCEVRDRRTGAVRAEIPITFGQLEVALDLIYVALDRELEAWRVDGTKLWDLRVTTKIEELRLVQGRLYFASASRGSVHAVACDGR